MQPGGDAQFSLAQYLARKIRRREKLRSPMQECASLRRVLFGLILVIPLIREFRSDGNRTWFMSRIRLPRNSGHGRRKMREPFDIKSVTETQINRHGDHRREKRGIEKRQLELQPMPIDILKVIRKF